MKAAVTNQPGKCRNQGFYPEDEGEIFLVIQGDFVILVQNYFHKNKA
jgi:hypothetical protein